MSKRTNSQHIGECAESSVKQMIGSSPYWVCRGQTHDYGVDLEAELCKPVGQSSRLTGQIVKIQVKGVASLKGRPKVYLSHNEIFYACQFKLPFILVLFDLDNSRAYWIWVQKYILYNEIEPNLLGKKRQRIDFDIKSDLALDLSGDLQRIASGEDRSSIELALSDTLLSLGKSGGFTEYHELLDFAERHRFGVSDIILNRTVSTLISRFEDGDKIMDWRESSAVLSTVCQRFRHSLSKETIIRMVARGSTYSRAGIGGLQNLYDSWGDSVREMRLSEFFLSCSVWPVAWYCAFRERHPEWKSRHGFIDVEDLVFSFQIEIEGGMLGLDSELADYISGKFPNRGDSVLLDCLSIKPLQT